MENLNKKKHAFWLTPEAKALVEKGYQQDNCRTQSEFVENAIRFYAGYLSAKDATNYLAPVLSQIWRGSLDSFGAHVNRNLFRLAVEDATTWNLIAGLFQVSPEKLRELHNKAVGEVKRMNGKLTYEKLFADPPVLDAIDITEDE